MPQHPTPSPTPHQASLPRVGGDRQLGLWPVVLVYHLGPAFLEPDSALAIWGLCRATPFPSQPLQPCSGSRTPKTTRGRGQGGHILIVTHGGCGLCGHRPRIRPRRYGERGWGEIRDLRMAWLKPTNPQPSPCMLCEWAKVDRRHPLPLLRWKTEIQKMKDTDHRRPGGR